MSTTIKSARRSAAKLADLASEIALLEEKRKELGTALAVQKQDLLLSTAQTAGLLERLSPDAIVAAIKAMAASAGKPDNGPAAETVSVAGLPPVQPDDRVTIEVKFGNHKSSNVARLEDAGLVRNGKTGYWRGEVDGTTSMDLAETFGCKLRIVAVRSAIRTEMPDLSTPVDGTTAVEEQSTTVTDDQASKVAVEPQPTPSSPPEEKAMKPASPFRGLPPRQPRKQDESKPDNT